MKNNIILICLMVALVFASCERDDSYDAPNSFSDVGWIFSDVDGPLDANIGDYITFTDASQGYSHHEWEIGEGNFYLEHPLGRNDRGDSLLRTKIIGSGSTTDKTVSVFFDRSGLQPVRLFNIFPEKVTFRGSDNFRYEAKPVADQWVIDTTFMVDVYAKIRPKVQIDHANGTEIWEMSEIDAFGSNINRVWTNRSTIDNNVITVEAGDAVDFTNITEIGRPETVAWKLINAANVQGDSLSYNNNGPSLGGGNTLNYTFSSLGDYYVGIRASRDSENIPNGFTSVVLPYRFNVIPSSKPFELLGDVVELEDETIRLNFTGEFQNATNQEQYFTVLVNGVSFNIASVTTNGTFLDIVLTDPIYRPDVITVSYDGNGDFKSTDERSPEAFTDVPVIMHNVSILPESIENTAMAGMDGTWFEAQSSGRFEFSTEQFVSGPTSVKATIGPGARAGMRANPSPAIPRASGESLLVSFKMYIDPASTVMPQRVAIFDIPRWSASSYNFTGSEPKGEWIDVQIILPPHSSANITGVLFRSDALATSDAVIYYDDFHIVVYEERP